MGGTGNLGTVFQISTNGMLTTLHSFTGGGDGGNPTAGLVQAGDGNFYGTTKGYYTPSYTPFGSVFKIASTGAFSNLYSFTGGRDGAYPMAGLVQGSDGYLYGTTQAGGTNYDGTLFKISTNGADDPLCFRRECPICLGHRWMGAVPNPRWCRAATGNFYGTTTSGGAITTAAGTVFKIGGAGGLTTVYTFTGGSDGGQPQSSLGARERWLFVWHRLRQRHDFWFRRCLQNQHQWGAGGSYVFPGGHVGASPLAAWCRAATVTFMGRPRNARHGRRRQRVQNHHE